MIGGRVAIARLFAVGAWSLLAIAWWSPPAAIGDEPNRAAFSPERLEFAAESDDGDSAEAPAFDEDRRRGGRRGPRFGRGLPPNRPPAFESLQVERFFPPRASDADPLRPGEFDELKAFACEHAPPICRVMERVDRLNAAQFPEAVHHLIARLRHVRRIFAYDESLGRLVIRHTINTREMLGMARRIGRASLPEWRAQHVRRMLRQRVSDNLGLEVEILTRGRMVLERDLQSRIDEHVRDLIAGDIETRGEDVALREMLRQIRLSDDPDTRAALKNTLRVAVEQHVTRELARVTQRLDRLTSDQDAEVERRMAELIEIDWHDDAGHRRSRRHDD